jgi:hypothetical protein
VWHTAGLVAFSSLVPFLAQVPARTGPEAPEITIRVYIEPGDPIHWLSEAQPVVERVFAQASIRTAWLDCRSPAEGRCGQGPRPNEFVVRLRRKRPDLASHGCGVSLRPHDLPGHYVTVFLDCIRGAADRLGIREAVIGAHTIAHDRTPAPAGRPHPQRHHARTARPARLGPCHARVAGVRPAGSTPDALGARSARLLTRTSGQQVRISWPDGGRIGPSTGRTRPKYSSIYGIAAIGAAIIGGIDLSPGAVIAQVRRLTRLVNWLGWGEVCTPQHPPSQPSTTPWLRWPSEFPKASSAC